MRSKKPTTDPRLLHSITEGLSAKPELASRIASIIELANEPTAEGRIRSADEVEALLVEELRKLGSESIEGWSKGVNEHLGKELKEEEPTAQMREKKL